MTDQEKLTFEQRLLKFYRHSFVYLFGPRDSFFAELKTFVESEILIAMMAKEKSMELGIHDQIQSALYNKAE